MSSEHGLCKTPQSLIEVSKKAMSGGNVVVCRFLDHCSDLEMQSIINWQVGRAEHNRIWKAEIRRDG